MKMGQKERKKKRAGEQSCNENGDGREKVRKEKDWRKGAGAEGGSSRTSGGVVHGFHFLN